MHIHTYVYRCTHEIRTRAHVYTHTYVFTGYPRKAEVVLMKDSLTDLECRFFPLKYQVIDHFQVI